MAYVRHYPHVADNPLEHAFADQIELRVLPKLRGLDTHDHGTDEAITGIINILDSELGDEKLVRALKDALVRSGDQLFHWAGVDRLRSEAQLLT